MISAVKRRPAKLRRAVNQAFNSCAWLFCALVIAGCSQSPEGSGVVEFSGATMGTTYRVTLAEVPADFDKAQAQHRVKQALERVNAQMSTYRDDSELSQLNRAQTNQWVPVSDALLQVIKQAGAINTQSAGAFDVTIGPLVNLWGFGPESKREQPPTEQEIDERMQRVGFKNLLLRDAPPAVSKKNAGVYVDLSAIAKGYGVDQVTLVLQQLGLKAFLVEIGGELYGQGKNAEGEPWQIAVERPEARQRAIQLVVSLQDQGMATSGDYRNFFQADGKRYSHTLDPRTGRPVAHNLRAVTVLAATTAEADAWATALLVLGPEQGFALAEGKKIAALFITEARGEYTGRMTTQFSPHVSVTP